MRHLSSGRKLSRSSSHRTALARSQATALLRHGRIKTTLTKAKNLQPYVEKLITTARGGDLHACRSFPQVRSTITTFSAVDERDRSASPSAPAVTPASTGSPRAAATALCGSSDRARN